MEKLCDIMQPIPRHRDREVATPFNGFYEAGGKVLLESVGQLL